jgi:hypothetical protein
MNSNWPTALQIDAEGRNNDKAWAKTMSNWMYMCYFVATTHGPGSIKHGRFEGFRCALAFGALPEQMATPATNYIIGFLTLFSEFVRISGEAHSYPRLLLSYNDQADHSKIYESKRGELSAGRRFCVTKRGSLAWVPRDTRLGDRMCSCGMCCSVCCKTCWSTS